MSEQKNKAAEKNGWKKEELDILAQELRAARDNGEPLRPAFERVAAKTGRKAGSIRNYYYTVYRKDRGESSMRTFETFTEEEIDRLLLHMLRAQAQGKSVRRAALELGQFDHSAMLRYQNKYRSLMKNRPDLVERAVQTLRLEGIEMPKARTPQLQAQTARIDAAQTHKTLEAIWQNMRRKWMRLPADQAAKVIEGLSCLFDTALDDTSQDLLAENEALRRENVGLIRQLEMIQTPFDGDVLAGGNAAPVRRAAHSGDMFHNTSRELAVFIPREDKG